MLPYLTRLKLILGPRPAPLGGRHRCPAELPRPRAGDLRHLPACVKALIVTQLRRRSVAARLGLVLSSLFAVTLLFCLWGPPFPYRADEVYAHDLRVRIPFELIDSPQTEWAREETLEALAGEDDSLTREAVQQSVPPVVAKYPKGMLLVPRGQPISERSLTLLKEEHRAFLRQMGRAERTRRMTALFLVMSLLASVIVLYVVRFQKPLARSRTKIAGIGILTVATLGLALWLSREPWHAALIPLSLTAMILTLVYNAQFALLMSFSLALALGVALETDLRHLLIMMGGMATAILLLRNVRRRTQLVEIGVAAGLAYLAMTAATGLLAGQTWRLIVHDAGRHLLWGSAAGFLLTGGLPLIERCFGVVTDASLLELAEGSHPLLQELIRRAPGTYIHSMNVATLAEAAAEAINAKPLLARVGSYFHDVGKMLKPHYFIENQAGENPHDVLEPTLSALLIVGHVKDGLTLARQYRLPVPVVDFIREHHGTTLLEYFYGKAARGQEGKGLPSTALEAAFRYPGPKPQSRETSIVMLADAVESASRSLKDPSPGSLRKLVHELTMKRLLDGQFEASGLTLGELHRIEESFWKGLSALYHGRLQYPELRSRKEVA